MEVSLWLYSEATTEEAAESMIEESWEAGKGWVSEIEFAKYTVFC